MASNTGSDTFWTLDKEAELVELWRSQPNLYDCSCKGYSNRNQKSKSHEFIANELGTTGNFYLKNKEQQLKITDLNM